jgi:hypothetical protein
MERSTNEINRAVPIVFETAVTALATFIDFSRIGGTLAHAVERRRGGKVFPGFVAVRHGGGQRP